MLFVNPFGKRQRLSAVLMLALLSLRVLRTAMFAEPAIPQIEKMGGLVHRTEKLSLSGANQENPSNAPELTSFCRFAKFEPEQFHLSDACREPGKDRLNYQLCRH